MNKLLTTRFGLMLALLLVAGCGGGAGGLQPSSLLSSSQNVAVSGESSSVRLHQPIAGGQQLAHSTSYTITDLGTLGGTFSLPTTGALNNRGAAAGLSTLAGDIVHRSFLWESGRMIDLGALTAGPNSDADSVNERLQITGAADGATSKADCGGLEFSTSSLDSHAYLWQNGTMTDLGTLGGKGSKGFWINNRGQIAGVSQINAVDPNPNHLSGCPPGSQIKRAFLFEGGKMQDIGTLGGFNSVAAGMNDVGQIVGVSNVSTMADPTFGFVVSHAFLRTNGVMKDLGTLGGGVSLAFALNNKGVVIGDSTLPGEQHVHAFLWQGSAMTDLGTVDGDTDSNAQGVNNVGQVVGDSDTSTTMRAFIWQKGVMTDLNTLISPNSGFQLASGASINDAGQIAAAALVERTGEMHAVLLTPSNSSFRGKAGGVHLTPSLRRWLLRGYGHQMMKVLTSNH